MFEFPGSIYEKILTVVPGFILGERSTHMAEGPRLEPDFTIYLCGCCFLLLLLVCFLVFEAFD